jgi:mono/diheme cytochrome c family protein
VIGIKKAVVLVAAALFATGLLAVRPNEGTAAAASSGIARSGPAEIYAAHCATCHGRDGRASTAKGKRAGATDLTSEWNRDPARGVRIITNGKGEMPSFKKKLTAAEIRAVFGYVSQF